ncbi:MAG: hypothetical protein LBF86_04860, partial [Helicobacteraceae bacterium]|nr:hypothetical protein [Helicobacteraceae bacterium]
MNFLSLPPNAAVTSETDNSAQTNEFAITGSTPPPPVRVVKSGILASFAFVLSLVFVPNVQA